MRVSKKLAQRQCGENMRPARAQWKIRAPPEVIFAHFFLRFLTSTEHDASAVENYGASETSISLGFPRTDY